METPNTMEKRLTGFPSGSADKTVALGNLLSALLGATVHGAHASGAVPDQKAAQESNAEERKAQDQKAPDQKASTNDADENAADESDPQVPGAQSLVNEKKKARRVRRNKNGVKSKAISVNRRNRQEQDHEHEAHPKPNEHGSTAMMNPFASHHGARSAAADLSSYLLGTQQQPGNFSSSSTTSPPAPVNGARAFGSGGLREQALTISWLQNGEGILHGSSRGCELVTMEQDGQERFRVDDIVIGLQKQQPQQSSSPPDGNGTERNQTGVTGQLFLENCLPTSPEVVFAAPDTIMATCERAVLNIRRGESGLKTELEGSPVLTTLRGCVGLGWDWKSRPGAVLGNRQPGYCARTEAPKNATGLLQLASATKYNYFGHSSRDRERGFFSDLFGNTLHSLSGAPAPAPSQEPAPKALASPSAATEEEQGDDGNKVALFSGDAANHQSLPAQPVAAAPAVNEAGMASVLSMLLASGDPAVLDVLDNLMPELLQESTLQGLAERHPSVFTPQLLAQLRTLRAAYTRQPRPPGIITEQHFPLNAPAFLRCDQMCISGTSVCVKLGGGPGILGNEEASFLSVKSKIAPAMQRVLGGNKGDRSTSLGPYLGSSTSTVSPSDLVSTTSAPMVIAADVNITNSTTVPPFYQRTKSPNAVISQCSLAWRDGNKIMGECCASIELLGLPLYGVELAEFSGCTGAPPPKSTTTQTPQNGQTMADALSLLLSGMKSLTSAEKPQTIPTNVDNALTGRSSDSTIKTVEEKQEARVQKKEEGQEAASLIAVGNQAQKEPPRAKILYDISGTMDRLEITADSCDQVLGASSGNALSSAAFAAGETWTVGECASLPRMVKKGAFLFGNCQSLTGPHFNMYSAVDVLFVGCRSVSIELEGQAGSSSQSSNNATSAILLDAGSQVEKHISSVKVPPKKSVVEAHPVVEGGDLLHSEVGSTVHTSWNFLEMHRGVEKKGDPNQATQTEWAGGCSEACLTPLFCMQLGPPPSVGTFVNPALMEALNNTVGPLYRSGNGTIGGPANGLNASACDQDGDGNVDADCVNVAVSECRNVMLDNSAALSLTGCKSVQLYASSVFDRPDMSFGSCTADNSRHNMQLPPLDGINSTDPICVEASKGTARLFSFETQEEFYGDPTECPALFNLLVSPWLEARAAGIRNALGLLECQVNAIRINVIAGETTSQTNATLGRTLRSYITEKEDRVEACPADDLLPGDTATSVSQCLDASTTVYRLRTEVEIFPQDMQGSENADIKAQLMAAINNAIAGKVLGIQAACPCLQDTPTVLEVGQVQTVLEAQRVAKIGVVSEETMLFNVTAQELMLDNSQTQYRDAKTAAAATMFGVDLAQVQLVSIEQKSVTSAFADTSGSSLLQRGLRTYFHVLLRGLGEEQQLARRIKVTEARQQFLQSLLNALPVTQVKPVSVTTSAVCDADKLAAFDVDKIPPAATVVRLAEQNSFTLETNTAASGGKISGQASADSSKIGTSVQADNQNAVQMQVQRNSGNLAMQVSPVTFLEFSSWHNDKDKPVEAADGAAVAKVTPLRLVEILKEQAANAAPTSLLSTTMSTSQTAQQRSESGMAAISGSKPPVFGVGVPYFHMRDCMGGVTMHLLGRPDVTGVSGLSFRGADFSVMGCEATQREGAILRAHRCAGVATGQYVALASDFSNGADPNSLDGMTTGLVSLEGRGCRAAEQVVGR
ncbi:unnamed protein product [Amoebophrya sp. A25]|nr:unnamed protein product [Amoebophrya sp. A25]|eukprot:GSA25T00011369001.1